MLNKASSSKFISGRTSRFCKVFLWRACWHIGVVNTVGLRLAKLMLMQPIEGSAPDKVEEETLNESPPGGVIDKDDHGIPTGILRERAVELIVAVMGKKSPQDTLRFISEGLRLCSSVGLTSVQANDACSLAVYENLRGEGSLPLRVFLTPNYEEIVPEMPCVRGDNPSASDEQRVVHPYRPQCMPRSAATSQVLDSYVTVPSGDQNRIDFSTPESRLIIERLKIYADGSLGAETAAMKIPIIQKVESLLAGNVDTADGSDSVHGSAAAGPDAAVDATVKLQHTGILTHSNGDLVRMVSHARCSGLRVEVHAIGDAAAEQVQSLVELDLDEGSDSV
jgi:predicted amidohydrolase YtcJ